MTIPRNSGVDADGVAQTEADHFPLFAMVDMRDLAHVAEQVHEDSEIEVLEGPGPPPR